MIDPAVETEARRIASERVPPTAQPTPDWQLAYRAALRELTRRSSLWRPLARRLSGH